ncbi:hypothetical protein B0H10DRAFT_2218033 [Mycena sp. CBHHK59/15]|nr:hypothetical protein B0H10DRAFT_2218033 [Mycena sp. CBHHK59/15]
MRQEGTLDLKFDYVPVPVGILQYFGDFMYGAPLEWSKRHGNVTYFVQKDMSVRGGHFPSHVNPDDLVNEARAFWGSKAGGWVA